MSEKFEQLVETWQAIEFDNLDAVFAHEELGRTMSQATLDLVSQTPAQLMEALVRQQLRRRILCDFALGLFGIATVGISVAGAWGLLPPESSGLAAGLAVSSWLVRREVVRSLKRLRNLRETWATTEESSDIGSLEYRRGVVADTKNTKEGRN